MIAIARAILRMRVARIPWTATERQLIVISVPCSLRLPPVVITIERVGAVAAAAFSTSDERSSSRESWSRGSKSIPVLPFRYGR